MRILIAAVTAGAGHLQAAAKVNSVDDLPFRLEQLFGSKKLAVMSRAAKALGRPAAAAEICRAVAELLKARPAA
jgi:hypothetical protein